MIVEYGKYDDIDSWMQLVHVVHSNFPGLETIDGINEHKCTVLKFMKEQRAICIKDFEKVVGVLLFSKKHNLICCLAVLPEYRKQGIATMLLKDALKHLDRTHNITVSTFRKEDPKGIAPRALYKKIGFVEDELIEEFGYPSQKFILYP
ncbi:GNAT family N-acetyltransferase [Anaerocolumna sedimenticola]|uniref:GNAT family N-acetyltransferase n=1 Tax=Anaerocolumna sedimenticola TaxID=2696063 RepID=A0A6P1TF61_9FIRM|nr:GNAT family N-acetyltransferase [Anaerocolumna sedimenticola]QHQ59794.1 GNAT family N-acetyltransferase [Anaerocolumna sedimenticola]